MGGEGITIVGNYDKGVIEYGRRTAKEIGIPKFGAHDNHHYFATDMIRRGINLYKLSKILGHASITTTERIYLHLTPVDIIGLTDWLCD